MITQVFLYLFSLLELIWNAVTLKMVKKVKTNLDSSKASGPNCIPIVVLNNCEPELSYTLATTLLDVHLNWLNWFKGKCPYSWGRSTRYSDRLHDFSVAIPRYYKDVYVNSLFPRKVRLWNSLPIECFPLTYDLSGFKSRINRHFLTVRSF